MPSFTHSPSGLTAGTTRTLAYGPVGAGVTAMVFSGVFTNNDTTNNLDHWITVETYDGTTYTPILVRVPLPWGSSSECPKLTLNAGESVYVTADAASVVTARLEIVTGL